jgi:hypothetical protein
VRLRGAAKIRHERKEHERSPTRALIYFNCPDLSADLVRLVTFANGENLKPAQTYLLSAAFTAARLVSARAAPVARYRVAKRFVRVRDAARAVAIYDSAVQASDFIEAGRPRRVAPPHFFTTLSVHWYSSWLGT